MVMENRMRQFTEEVRQAACQFSFEGILEKVEPYGNGHINDTFLLTYAVGKMGCIRVILQKMNQKVFPEPEALMENVVAVTSFLRSRIVRNGGDPYRETLNVIPAKDGKSYVRTEGGFWRSFMFVADTCCYDQAEKAEDLYEAGMAFGNFQRLLADFPARKLHETIRDFHNTKKRLADFQKALREDAVGRAGQVQEETAFVLERKKDACFFQEMLERGELPVRVTHNDTKLNNVLLDARTRRGLCVIDLDTTMPGLAMYDFGDAVRSGASTAAEDEKDLSRVSLDLNFFEKYAEGFLKGCGGSLTQREISLLPMGAKVMTYECGMRFLTDYLKNDVYFKTRYPEHNLDRARTQFRLVADMEQKRQKMEAVIAGLQ